MRRATRPRQPNQRACKHDFYKFYAAREPGSTRRGLVLGCAKCALVRTIRDDGTMRDGPVNQQRVTTADTGFTTLGNGGGVRQFFADPMNLGPAALGMTAAYDTNRRDPTPRPLNAAARIDAAVGNNTQPNGPIQEN